MWWNKLKTIKGISLKDKLLLIRILFLSCLFRATIICIPFKYISRFMGIKGEESKIENMDKSEKELLSKIRWAVNGVCNHTPWKSLCLVKALTTQKILKGLGKESTLYLGVSRDKEGEIKAHAWIRCKGFYVVGGEGSGYSVIAKYKKQ